MRSAAVIIVLALVPGSAAAQETGELVISEIMYHSALPPGSLEEIEYFELYNHTDTPVDLTGWYVLDDNDAHVPVALAGNLAPGDVLVIVGDMALFAQQYPGVTNVNPTSFQPQWGLRNSSDTVRVFNTRDELVDAVTYCDGNPPDIDRPPSCPEWPTSADGNGPSLELINPAVDNNDASNWTAGAIWGSPGIYQPTPVEPATWGLVKSLHR